MMRTKPTTPMNTLTVLRRTTVALLVIAPAYAYADPDCERPPAEWRSRAAVERLAEERGWQIHKLKIDDGCYEIKGHDAEGNRFKAKLDPATLEIVGMKRERRESGHHRAAEPTD